MAATKPAPVSDLRDLIALSRTLEKPVEELRGLLDAAVALGVMCRVESGERVAYGLSPWGPT